MERYEVKTSELHLAFDPEQEGLTTVYLASEVDALLSSHVVATDQSNLEALHARVAELEREVRELVLANTALKAELDYYHDEG